MVHNISFGTVISTEDPTGAGRVLVKLPSADMHSTDEKWAFPLLPKMLHIRPKLNETVMVITREVGNQYSDRFYIGPVISQPQHTYLETDSNSALRVLHGTRLGPDENIEDVSSSTHGTQPAPEDVAILGRKDSDIILTDDDIRIRCGVKKTNDNDMKDFSFNGVHPAFIKLKHHGTEAKDRGYESAINIVADKINLIGTDARGERFDVKSQTDLITDDEVDRFIKEAHQLPFGDKLIEFLRIFITAFQSHTHRWVGRGMTPCKDITYNTLANYQLESILSTTVRIN